MCMTPHGPDAATFEAAVGGGDGQQGPAHLPDDSLAFMFEAHWTPRVTTAVRTSKPMNIFQHITAPPGEYHHGDGPCRLSI